MVWFGLAGFLMVRKDFITAAGVEYSADMVLKIKTDFLHYVITEILSFPMIASFEKLVPRYLDPRTVLIPVGRRSSFCPPLQFFNPWSGFHWSEVWIRILLSPSKNRKKNLDSYCIVTSL
jgi:hypothetical protein